MKKVLVMAVAIYSICNVSHADIIIDMEFGFTDSTATQPNIGGAGYQSIITPAGFTGPLYIWVYAKVTNGPVTPMSGYDDALITCAQGTITETSSGIHGNMSWGATKSTNATRQTYLYSAGYPTGYPDFSAGSLAVGSTNAYGDLDINQHSTQFAPVNGTGGVETGDYNTWIPLGHFAYTIKSASAGQAIITFNPDTSATGALYQYLNSQTGEVTDALGGNTGYSTTGELFIGLPEPSTSILLTAGMATMILRNWLRRKKKR